MGRYSSSETDIFPNITRRATCGNWQQEYSHFHRNTLVGESEIILYGVNNILINCIICQV